MPIGLVGRKCGMTRVFAEDGRSIPVTVIEVPANRVVQVKTVERDGYQALQVTAGEKSNKRLTKPVAGHFAKANVAPGYVTAEIALAQDEEGIAVGDELAVDGVFEQGDSVDVTGTSKGKGFQGGVKRWGFSMQDATHGNSLSHRAPGSIGQNQTPGRVFKGKKMAGQMGNVRQTIQNQEVVRVDADRGLLLVKGGVPGAPGSYVFVNKAVKSKGKK